METHPTSRRASAGRAASAAVSTAIAAAAAVALAPLAVPAQRPCPDGMARVEDAFCVDRYEASLVEVTAAGDRPWSPYHSPRGARVRAVSRRGVVPQGHISATLAQAACRAAGKRLCANHEWTRACMGPRRTQFPYGGRFEDGRCNTNHTRHPVVQLFGHTRRPIWDGVHMNDPQINQLPGTLALTGAFGGCTNEYGVHDMVGNLYEWSADAGGTFRGGFYMTPPAHGPTCWYTAVVHDATYFDYSTGFRCCADAPDA